MRMHDAVDLAGIFRETSTDTDSSIVQIQKKIDSNINSYHQAHARTQANAGVADNERVKERERLNLNW